MILQFFKDQTLLSIFSAISYKFSFDGYIKEGILDVPCNHCISFFTFLWTGLVLLWLMSMSSLSIQTEEKDYLWSSSTTNEFPNWWKENVQASTKRVQILFLSSKLVLCALASGVGAFVLWPFNQQIHSTEIIINTASSFQY